MLHSSKWFLDKYQQNNLQSYFTDWLLLLQHLCPLFFNVFPTYFKLQNIYYYSIFFFYFIIFFFPSWKATSLRQKSQSFCLVESYIQLLGTGCHAVLENSLKSWTYWYFQLAIQQNSPLGMTNKGDYGGEDSKNTKVGNPSTSSDSLQSLVKSNWL